MGIDKYFLNLAGEYRVAAELLKREVFATITYGNRKGADETKPHPDFWVLYSLAGVQSERFFILTHGELAHVQAQRNSPGRAMSWADSVQAAAGGVDNVLAEHLDAHESCWHKIVDYCSAEQQ